MMSTKREEEMLRYLMTKPGWHSVQELSIFLDVSGRSVKKYYKNLSADHPVVSSKLGYKYEGTRKIKEKQPELKGSKIPTTKRERIFYVLNRLLSNDAPVNVYDLAEEIFASESNLKLDFKAAVKYAKNFDLTLKQRGDYFSISGSEEDKRHMLSDMLYKESDGNFISKSIIRSNFPTIDLDGLYTITQTCAKDHHIYLNTFDLNNIVLHVVIAIQRIRDGYQTQPQLDDFYWKSSRFAKVLLKEVENSQTNVRFSKDDLESLGLVIDGSVSRWTIDMKDSISESSLRLIRVILAYVKSIYKIDLTGPDFINQFAIHVSRLIQRLRDGKSIQNPMANQMKAQSPTVYECAVLISHKIANYVGVPVPDNEIAYIAMHIGNAIAKQIEDKERLRTTILIPDYQGKFLSIVDQIEKNFGSELAITKVVTTESTVENDLDLLIAFTDRISTRVPSVQISPFFTKNDNRMLKNKIDEIGNEKRRRAFDSQIGTFFDQRFFTISRQLKTKEAVIEHIANAFYQAKVTDQDYQKDLLDREQMSSTAFGKIAIPHSLTMKAHSTKGFIYINPNGLTWGTSRVYLVFALAVRKEDSKLFRNIFDRLSDVMTEEKNIAELVGSTSYEDFLGRIKGML